MRLSSAAAACIGPIALPRRKSWVRCRTGLNGSPRSPAPWTPGQAIIDGEVVVVHEGRTNFSELQAGLAAGRQDRLIYYAFDLLWRDGDLRKSPRSSASRRGRLGLGIAGRGHGETAGPHDCVPGFAFQPIGLADFRLGGAPDQNGFPVVAFVDPVGVPDPLRQGLPVPAGQRDVDDPGRPSGVFARSGSANGGFRIPVCSTTRVKSARVFLLIVEGSGSRGCRIFGRSRTGQDSQKAGCHTSKRHVRLLANPAISMAWNTLPPAAHRGCYHRDSVRRQAVLLK